MNIKGPVRTVIEEARDIMPRTAVTLSRAYDVAEAQAARLVQLLGFDAPHVTFDTLLDLPNIEVRIEPKYRMNHCAGISRFSKGRWQILVDGNDVHGRRRYTFAHEIKHVLDHGLDQIAYAELGYGDEEQRRKHVEAICQHFAACFLMPRDWVIAWWTRGFQDVYNLAALFQVSITAMDIRLRKLGLSPQPPRDVHTYFRTASIYPPCLRGDLGGLLASGESI